MLSPVKFRRHFLAVVIKAADVGPLHKVSRPLALANNLGKILSVQLKRKKNVRYIMMLKIKWHICTMSPNWFILRK